MNHAPETRILGLHLPHWLGVGMALTLALCAGLLAYPWFAAWDARLTDAFWRMSGEHGHEERLVVVDIDEASLNEIGPWPWPRERLAELARRLSEQGAALQIYDVVLNAAQEGDAEFASLLASQPTVLAQVFALEQGAPIVSGDLAGAASAVACRAPMPQAHGHIGVAPAYRDLAAGHITPRVSTDGIIRQQPAFICQQDKAYPALSLVAYLRGIGVDKTLELRPGSGTLAPAWTLWAEGLPSAIPLNERADMEIPYRVPPASILAVSAADVLKGAVTTDILQGRWVIISSTAFGLADVVSTPYGGAQGGVSVHVQLLAALLDEAIPVVPRGQTLLQVVVTGLGAGLLLLVLGLGRRLPWPVYTVSLVAIALAFALLALQAMLQIRHGLLLGMTLPALSVMLTGFLLGLAEHVITNAERSKVYGFLTSYLPEPVAKRLLGQTRQSMVHAERRDAVVLYADIRNFSSYCETHAAEEAANVLHDFFVTTCDVVERYGGIVESMHGDAILATWNGSSPCPGASEKALRAAAEIHARVESRLSALPLPTDDRQPPLALGIGIERGEVLLGSFGPASRRVHTALGKTVTIAVRLQGMTADLAWPILIGPGLYQQLVTPPPNLTLLPQGEFLLEGLIQACPIYAVAHQPG